MRILLNAAFVLRCNSTVRKVIHLFLKVAVFAELCSQRTLRHVHCSNNWFYLTKKKDKIFKV